MIPRDMEALTAHPLATVLLFAALGALPFLFMGLTAFLKISTVLHITRTAIGATSIPSNAIVLGLSVALTLVAMIPVGLEIERRLQPVTASAPQSTGAWLADVAAGIREPLRQFLNSNASAEEKRRFHRLVQDRHPADQRDAVKETDLMVLIPSFMITELLEAFALGVAIFLPFLVIDLVVASVQLALGLTGLTTTQISLPLKLLLFVSTDGWGLIAESLISGYK